MNFYHCFFIKDKKKKGLLSCSELRNVQSGTLNAFLLQISLNFGLEL